MTSGTDVTVAVETSDPVNPLFFDFDLLVLAQPHPKYQSELQDTTNRSLNVLTIVQAIFAPLTLIVAYRELFEMSPSEEREVAHARWVRSPVGSTLSVARSE